MKESRTKLRHSNKIDRTLLKKIKRNRRRNKLARISRRRNK